MVMRMRGIMSKSYIHRLKELKSSLEEADFVLIGAGAGLSIAAGLIYDGQRFEKYFSEFIKKYDMRDMYSAGFYPFASQEHKWAYWSKHIEVNRYNEDTIKLYEELLDLIKEKNYFVLTTNVDGLFYKGGFPKEKVFMVQGDYGKFQCSIPCHNKLYDNKETVFKMTKEQKGCKIPSELIPRCPKCKTSMEVNIRKDHCFLQDEFWDKSNNAYRNFLLKAENKKLLLLEFGVGYNTPSIIKYPFENMINTQKNTKLIRFNLDSRDNSDNLTTFFDEQIPQIIEDLKQI